MFDYKKPLDLGVIEETDSHFQPLSNTDVLNLSYNGEFPKYDFMFVGNYRVSTQEFFDEDITCLNLKFHHLSIEDLDCEWENGIRESFPDDFTDLKFFGIYNIVALGKFHFHKYHTEYGYEYESEIQWEIISANKFPNFSELKSWWKEWKRINQELVTEFTEQIIEKEREIPDTPPASRD